MSRRSILMRMDELELERKLNKIRYLVVGIAQGDTYKYYVEDTKSGTLHKGEDAAYFAGPFDDAQEAYNWMSMQKLNQ